MGDSTNNTHDATSIRARNGGPQTMAVPKLGAADYELHMFSRHHR